MHNLKSQLGPILIAILCLSGCGTAISEPLPAMSCTAPAWPVAGPAVASEMERLPVDEFPATWDWFARLEKLKAQLAVMR
jgi:hypothetical protein